MICPYSWSASMHDFSFELPTEPTQTLKMADLKGKVVMVVNIATQCGFTGQLDDMEKLYEKYQGKDFVLIGVPSNDFRSQTPEDDKAVASFCKLNYKTSFPITKKVHVKADAKDMHPFFVYLEKLRGGARIKWNFEKFVFNKKGELVDHFYSLRSPNSSKITGLIDKLLAEKI